MAITKPKDMDFSDKHNVVVISGTPGLGKSTLASSAPDPLIIDADNGMCRVRAEHRKDTCICKTFEEVKADIAEARKLGCYKTIVVDTGGALVDMMKQYVISHPDIYGKGGKATGGLSQQGFGFVKQLFLDFSADLRKDFNVIYIFHEAKSKEDEITTYEIICEGSSKTLVYQPADLAAHMFISGNKRMLAFSPTEQYFAKGAYGIKGIMEVPELTEGRPNDFLTRLFNQIRETLTAETDAHAKVQEQYEELMESVKEFMPSVVDAATANQCFEVLGKMEHVLTSKQESWDMLKKRAEEVGAKYDGRKKAFVDVE